MHCYHFSIMSVREVTASLLWRLRLSCSTARHGRGAWRCPQPTFTWWPTCDRVPRAYVTCSVFSILERGTERRGWDDGKRPQEVFVESLQGQHEVVHPCGPSALLAQPTDELEAQLRCKAAEVLQPNFFQETPSVSPEHHVNVHVLGAVAVLAPPVGGTRKLQHQRSRTTSRGWPQQRGGRGQRGAPSPILLCPSEDRHQGFPPWMPRRLTTTRSTAGSQKTLLEWK